MGIPGLVDSKQPQREREREREKEMTPLLVTVLVLITNSHFSHGQLPTQAQAFAQYAKAQAEYTQAQAQFAEAQAQFAETQAKAQAQAQLAILYNRLNQNLPSNEASKQCVERPEIQPRNITFARLTDLRLTLTWSDCAKTYADLKLEGDEDDCIYEGGFEDDSDSKVLVTGCEDIEVQIHSVVIGDWLFTTKDGHALAIDMGDYDYHSDTLENPEFENMFPTAEKNQII